MPSQPAVWSVARASEIDWNAVKKPEPAEFSRAWEAAISRYQLQADQPSAPVIDDSLVPRETAASKKAYIDILKHDIKGARVYGHPGSGLADSGFGQTQVKSGSKGEEIFAKLLSWDHILEYCSSYWSVWNPEKDGEKNDHGTDIDCILKFGDHIFLIDVKNYRSGVDYHTLIPGKAMFCMYSKARVVAHEPYIFSANMAFAHYNLSHYLQANGSPCTVESYVVLVPSTTGQAVLDADICWPGGIHAMSYTSFVNMLSQRAQQDPSYLRFNPEKTREELYLASLVKSYRTPLLKLELPDPEPSLWPTPTYDPGAGIMPKAKAKTKKAKPQARTRQSAESNNRHSVHANDQSDRFDGDRPDKPSRSYQRGKQSFAHNADRNQHRSDAARKSKRGFRTLYAIPKLDMADLSFECAQNDDGDMEKIRFAGVAGAVMAGERGAGSVMCISGMLAALIADGGVDVRIVDCNRTSAMEIYEDYVYSYVRVMDGLDLVSGEIQEAYTSLKTRARKLKQQGLDDFWADAGHGGLRPQMLYLHETSKLFAVKSKDESDEQSLNDIRRYLSRILAQGAKVGVFVLMSTQKPSASSLPPSLLAGCTWRACLHVNSKAAQQAVLDGVDTHGLQAVDITDKEIGKALLITSSEQPRMARFLPVSSKAIEKRFPQ